ncbi:hypothetical protein DERF_003454 [Dermatophagoides farinae]|uniref:Uncharacterized protein n=1 Tax=Dermatophagoides farinae TaxID=6954 RepID=A0A922IF23_DERFA|nr:hypothetical protein DERF_003454 [Dermatophagoides farinae]
MIHLQQPMATTYYVSAWFHHDLCYEANNNKHKRIVNVKHHLGNLALYRIHMGQSSLWAIIIWTLFYYDDDIDEETKFYYYINNSYCVIVKIPQKKKLLEMNQELNQTHTHSIHTNLKLMAAVIIGYDSNPDHNRKTEKSMISLDQKLIFYIEQKKVHFSLC